MEYIYSALLLHSAGKEITEDNIKKVLDAAGVKSDSSRIKALTASLDGVNIDEAMATSVAVPTAAAPAAAGAPAPEAEKGEAKEEKKEKKKKEEKEVSEEEAAAGLGALFG
jgi:large subunit ribosomal protein L12